MAKLQTDQQLLIEIAKLGAEATRVSLNAMRAADKSGYAKDLRNISNRLQEALSSLRSEIVR